MRTKPADYTRYERLLKRMTKRSLHPYARAFYQVDRFRRLHD